MLSSGAVADAETTQLTDLWFREDAPCGSDFGLKALIALLMLR